MKINSDSPNCQLIERFLRYVKFDTQSAENAGHTPSTEGQRIFALRLADELCSIGLSEVQVDEHAYLTATLPANTDEPLPVIGFIAHLDTSSETSGVGVKPRIVEQYDGGDILLNKTENIVLSPVNFPELRNYIGQDLIVTDGNTLLGADDKAGIAEIVTAMEHLLTHPEIKHGKVCIAFTPDEEIGHGAALLDIAKFGADWAYTVDGGAIGELEFENFNAARATLTFRGLNVHPGEAKGKMRNSQLAAARFINALPEAETPACTEGYEGFYHLFGIEGTVEKTMLSCLIRDHSPDRFEQRKETLRRLAAENHAEIELQDQYRNMRERIEPVIHIVERAKAAMETAGVQTRIVPVRGGTDGAQLSFRDLPCPNLFAGGHNFHGRFEYIPVQSMQKAVEVIINIVKTDKLK